MTSRALVLCFSTVMNGRGENIHLCVVSDSNGAASNISHLRIESYSNLSLYYEFILDFFKKLFLYPLT